MTRLIFSPMEAMLEEAAKSATYDDEACAFSSEEDAFASPPPSPLKFTASFHLRKVRATMRASDSLSLARVALV